MSRGRWSAAIVGGLGGLVVLGLLGTPALAHTRLVSSDPAQGAQLAAPPPRVVLTFSESVDPRFVAVAVTAPDQTSVVSGKPEVQGRTVTQSMKPGPAGAYTVAYRVVSLDGHPVQGAVTFTAASGAASPGTASPGAASPTPTSSPTLVARAAPTTGPGHDAAAHQHGTTDPWWPWAVLGALLALLAVLGAVLVIRRSKTSAFPDGNDSAQP